MEPQFVMQPNEYSCGTTSLYVAAKAIGVLLIPDINNLMEIMGTNPITGTTNIEMEIGLKHLGIPIDRYANKENGDKFYFGNAEEAFLSLKNTLKKNNSIDNKVFLLRTLMGGIFHWIVVYENENPKLINYVCSVTGKSTLDKKSLFKIWEPRKFDGYIVY